MGHDLVVYENAIDQTMPTIANILAATPGLPARSFKAAMLSQMVQSKASEKLLACTLPSFLNCAATFAGLGLMPDGVTGQAYMLPFAGVATPVIGYKGYNTLGERAGRTIDGAVVREGDDFDFERGTAQWVKHRPRTGPSARITYAWAAAMSPHRSPIISVLTIEDLEAIRLKAPAGKNSSSPWMDLSIGRPAMYEKSAKRRLARAMPLLHGSAGNYVRADAIEGQFEITGQPHYLLPGANGEMQITNGITGERKDVQMPSDMTADPTQPFTFRAAINAGQPLEEFDKVSEWKAALLRIVSLNTKRPGAVDSIRKANAEYLSEASAAGFQSDALEISQAMTRAIETAQKAAS